MHVGLCISCVPGFPSLRWVTLHEMSYTSVITVTVITVMTSNVWISLHFCSPATNDKRRFETWESVYVTHFHETSQKSQFIKGFISTYKVRITLFRHFDL